MEFQVLSAIADLKEAKGSDVKSIIKYLDQKNVSEGKKPTARKAVMKALKEGIELRLVSKDGNYYKVNFGEEKEEAKTEDSRPCSQIKPKRTSRTSNKRSRSPCSRSQSPCSRSQSPCPRKMRKTSASHKTARKQSQCPKKQRRRSGSRSRGKCPRSGSSRRRKSSSRERRRPASVCKRKRKPAAQKRTCKGKRSSCKCCPRTKVYRRNMKRWVIALGKFDLFRLRTYFTFSQ